MSVQAMAWVLTHSDATGNDRLVLLVIANYTNLDPLTGAWEAEPTIDRVAAEARLTKRTAQRSIANLVRDGHLEIEKNGARDTRLRRDRRPNLYRILGAQVVDNPVDDAARPGAKPVDNTESDDHGVTLVARSAPSERSEASRTRRRAVPVVDKPLKTNPPTPLVTPSGVTPSLDEVAHEVTCAWWEERQAGRRPPAQKFLACRGVVRSALANGVSRPDVEWALRNAPVVSGASLELALRTRRTPGRRVGSNGRHEGANALAARLTERMGGGGD